MFVCLFAGLSAMIRGAEGAVKVIDYSEPELETILSSYFTQLDSITVTEP